MPHDCSCHCFVKKLAHVASPDYKQMFLEDAREYPAAGTAGAGQGGEPAGKWIG
jgi:hypothetical protein